MQGTIYYNSYGTALVKNSDGLDSYGKQYGAGTLAIAPGATAPTLVAGVNSARRRGGNGTGCRVCHTVAANGQSLVTQALERQRERPTAEHGRHRPRERHDGRGGDAARDGEPDLPGTLQGRQPAALGRGRHRSILRRWDEPELTLLARRERPSLASPVCRPTFRPRLPVVLPGRRSRLVQLLGRVIHARRRSRARRATRCRWRCSTSTARARSRTRAFSTHRRPGRR